MIFSGVVDIIQLILLIGGFVYMFKTAKEIEEIVDRIHERIHDNL